MEETDPSNPLVPSNGGSEPVIDLTASADNFSFEDMINENRDLGSAVSPPDIDGLSAFAFLDPEAEPGAVNHLERHSDVDLAEWDTSVIDKSPAVVSNTPVAKRDYEALLLTARLSMADDSHLDLPWEKGVMKSIFDEGDSFPFLPTQVLNMTGDALHGFVAGDQAASSGEPEPKVLSWLHRDVELPIHACAVKVLPDRDFFQELEVLWVRAIDKWLNVFEILGYPGALGDAVFLELQQDENPNHRAMVRDSLGLKSPRTALKRAQSLLKYFQWLRSMSDVWDPWSVKACIDYMSSGNSKGPVASRGTTLLEAFRFCKFVMGIPVPDSLLNNPLVNGRALRLSADSAEYHPARSFKALEVVSLERLMLTDIDVVDKYMLGAVLFCIFSRSRWSDIGYIDQLWVEREVHDGEVFGFIECRTRHHKTATSVRKKRQFMPVVCPLLGISGGDWVTAWMKSFEALGIDITAQPFGALCRAASSDGGLCARSCATEEIGVFINAALKTTDPLTSHSMKHTTLEWCSSYGIDEDARKLLGHHSLLGGKALAVYSRDLLNRPLQLYCSMLRNIRLDHFRPDESRTSRLIDALKIQAGIPTGTALPEAAATTEASESGAPAQVFSNSDDKPTEGESVAGSDQASDDSDSSSSSSSEESVADEKHDVEKHDWISGPVWRNRRSKVVHKVSNSFLTIHCGRALEESKFEYLKDGCSTLFARCGVCFKGEVLSTAEGLADKLKSLSSKRARVAS